MRKVLPTITLCCCTAALASSLVKDIGIGIAANILVICVAAWQLHTGE